MKRVVTILAVSLSASVAMPALAGSGHEPMKHAQAAAGEKAESMAMMAEGTVRKINKARKRITIKHGPLANLNMPPMTMVFRVKDEAMLDSVKPGDKVNFRAEDLGGALTVTEIEAAK